MPNTRKIRPLGIHSQVALLHQRHIDRGFLSVLGESFLTLLYWAIDSDEDSVLLVEEREGRVVGFIAGTNSLGSIYRRMLCRPFELFLSLGRSFFSFSRFKRMLEILCYSRKSKTKAWGDLPRAELLSIVVSPAYRGQGLADLLYARLKGFFSSRDVPEFKITVGADLRSAHRFYNRMGARPVHELELHAGAMSILYLHDLKTEQESEKDIVEDFGHAPDERD